MAANVFDEEERNRRIKLVGQYFIDNPNTSTREAADYFSKNYFKISNATIHDYLQRYKKLMENSPELTEAIDNTLENNKPDTIDNLEIRKRVILVCKMYLQDYKTVEQIADELGESYWTIYRDLTTRLEQVNPMLYKIVDAQLNSNSLDNLKNKGK